MFPERQLTALAAEKAALLERIGENRIQCAEAAAQAARPLAWADDAIARLRSVPVPPIVRFAAAPLASFLLKRWLASNMRKRLFNGSAEETAETAEPHDRNL